MIFTLRLYCSCDRCAYSTHPSIESNLCHGHKHRRNNDNNKPTEAQSEMPNRFIIAIIRIAEAKEIFLINNALENIQMELKIAANVLIDKCAVASND